MNVYTVLILTIASISAAGGQLLFKVGAHGRSNLIEYINMPILSGLLLYAVGTVMWIYVLSFQKLVNVYAFTVLTFALVYLGGVFLLGETITIGGIVGVFLVLSGLYVITVYSS